MTSYSTKNYSSSLHKSKLQVKQTIFGTLLIIIGLAGGVILVSQPQLLGSRAIIRVYSTPTSAALSACPMGVNCSNIELIGGTRCVGNSGNGIFFCCQQGQRILNNMCTGYEECGEGLHCDWEGNPRGSSRCVAGDVLISCCPQGKIIRNSRCVIPYATPVPSGQPTPDICDQNWFDGSCGEGGCKAFQRYQFRIVPEGCGSGVRCVPDLSCII